MKAKRVLGLGAVTVDDLLYLDHYPAPDEKMPVQGRQREAGGLAGTALATAARLGVPAAFYGILGEDEWSRFTLESFERDGVNCDLVERRAGAGPQYSLILVDTATARRTILYDTALVTEPDPDVFQDEWLADCGALFVDHTVPHAGLRAAKLARAHNIPVVGDIEALAPVDSVMVLLSAIDHLVVGVEMAQTLSGKMDPADMASQLSQGRACCVVTAGASGCWYAEADAEPHHQAALPVKAVNTNGCGDVFHGAYAVELARGSSVSWAVRIATFAASLKAAQPGGRSGIPDYDTVLHYAKT